MQFKMSSAISFSLDQSEIFLSVNGLIDEYSHLAYIGLSFAMALTEDKNKILPFNKILRFTKLVSEINETKRKLLVVDSLFVTMLTK